MKSFFSVILGLFLVIAVQSSACASLYDIGNGMIYCDTLNVTFLEDANYAATSGYDSDGRMTWQQATAWASSLNYQGLSGWRLPTAYDVLYGTNPPGGSPGSYDVTGSEMGHLFHREDLGFFNNIQNWIYWTSMEWAGSGAWDFDFRGGSLGAGIKSDLNYAFAVRDGGSAPIPEPTTILLLSFGLFGISVCRKKFNRH